MGKIIYGNKNLGYAPIVSNEGSKSFGTPVMLKGMVSSSAEVEESESKIYADNEVYCIVDGTKVTSLSAVVKYITDEYALFLGFKQEANGMLVDTGVKPKHCIFFESTEFDCETGVETNTLHYFYNVRAQQPNEETSTTEGEVEATDLTIEYEALKSDFVLDSEGKKVCYGKLKRTESNKTLYDSFKTKVILPTSAL